MGGEEWKGWRFFLVSLIFALVSVILLFFAGYALPLVRTQSSEAAMSIARRIKEWGGIRLNRIELSLTNSEDFNAGPLPELYGKLRQDLSIFRGQPFWTLNLGEVRKNIESYPWVGELSIHRRFPDSLEIQIKPREARFLVKSSKNWCVLDSEGYVIWISREIPGNWLGLPLVFGKEEIFSRGTTPENLNRKLATERMSFKELHKMIQTVESLLSFKIDSIQWSDDAWTQGHFVRLSAQNAERDHFDLTLSLSTWSSRLESLQYILSDLRQRGIHKAHLLGQYDGRWIVEKGAS